MRVHGVDMWGHLHRMASAAPENCRYNHNMSSDLKSWESASPAPWVQTVEKRFWYASPSWGPFIGRFLGVHFAVHCSLASWDRSAIRYEALFAAAVALAVALQARSRFGHSRSTSARRAAQLLSLGQYWTEAPECIKAEASGGAAILHRQQTDELKGVLQCYLLLYHYLDSAKRVPSAM